MKYLFLLLILVTAQFDISSQNLIELYKTGTVRLVPDNNFAQDADWEAINPQYEQFKNKKESVSEARKAWLDSMEIVFRGKKSLFPLSNGNILINQVARQPLIYNTSGQYFKSIDTKSQKIIGQLDENTIFASKKHCKADVYDLDGNYIKDIKFNRLPYKIVPIGDNKLLVRSVTLWSKDSEHFVEIIDCNTNTTKTLWEQTYKRDQKRMFHYYWKLESVPQSREIITMPFTKYYSSFLPILCKGKNDVVLAMPKTGEIHFFDYDGNLKFKRQINWKNDSISVEEQRIIQQKAIGKYKKGIIFKNPEVMRDLESYKQVIQDMELDLKKINKPIPKPAFTNIIKDSDDNLLFFTMPKERGANNFHVYVYTENGEFKTNCTFKCDDYNLSISSKKMYFEDGYIYSIQELKNSKVNSYRLVRFKLEAI